MDIYVFMLVWNVHNLLAILYDGILCNFNTVFSKCQMLIAFPKKENRRKFARINIIRKKKIIKLQKNREQFVSQIAIEYRQ